VLTLRFRRFLKYGFNSLWNASLLLENLWRLRVRQPSQAVLNLTSWTCQTSRKRLKLSSSSEFTGAPSELFSTGGMPAIKPTDVPANDKDYDQALSLLTQNPAERRLDIRMPYSQYLKLEKSWSKFKAENNIPEEKKYPSLSYNALMQIATVVTTQSALRDRTAAALRKIIESNVNEYLSVHKPSERRRITDNASTTMKELSPHGRTSKEADESLMYDGPDREPRLQVAIECGFSENYKDLCRDKDLWIGHLAAKVVILICLNEAPRFNNPGPPYENITDPVAEVKKMRQHAVVAMKHNLEQGVNGPIEYRSHMWVGKLDEVFVEVWRAGEEQPVRKWLIRDGHLNRLPKTVGLKISDFFPEDVWAAIKIADSVSFRGGGDLLDSLRGSMQLTASMRFIDFLYSLGLPKS
ncbi:uncharacterized protein V1513DRAFT_385347, partial [Lipomyces chichibuensis]|uniref:uncharacterized protein n=1 Tax=Lipomyces chichibuensis TaxID=1546026 RepID=UPI0033432ADF